jgi:hypothetical protein
VSHILDKPPADSYNALKNALLALYVKTPLEDAYELLNIGDLGNQLASTHYRNLRKLWNDNGEAVFKAIFLRSLPQNLQDALADDDKDVASLSERADKIIKNRRANQAAATIHAISAAPCGAELAEINAIRQKYANKEKPAAKNHVPKDNTGFCFAHRKFGKDAYSCRGPPCPMAGILATKPAGKDNAGR